MEEMISPLWLQVLVTGPRRLRGTGQPSGRYSKLSDLSQP